MRRKKLYVAAPLFSAAELTFNAELKAILSSYCEVFLPQQDGGLIVELVASGVPREQAVRQVFEIDVRAVQEADILLIVLDGRSVDEGACFELGLAYALGKVCVGLQTDQRRLLPTGNNPMLEAALLHVFSGVVELVAWIRGSFGQDILAPLPGQDSTLSDEL